MMRRPLFGRVTVWMGSAVAVLSLGLLIGSAENAGASPARQSQTVTWHGNGTNGGLCSNLNEGLTGVPPGEQGWLFILTSPASGPWALTATFNPGATMTTGGTQMGQGSIHFVVYTTVGATLVSASATHGSAHSVLTVSGCTANGEPTTTVPTTTTPTTTTPTGGTVVTTAPPTAASGSKGAGSSVAGATTVHTGEPWAGSTPAALAGMALGGGLIGLGQLGRRRVRRVSAS